MTTIIYCSISTLCAICVTFIYMRKVTLAKILNDTNNSHSRIKALESELDSILHNKNEKLKLQEENFMQELENKKQKAESSLEKNAKELEQKYKNLQDEIATLESTKEQILKQKQEQEIILKQCKTQRENLVNALSTYTSLTKDEGKKILLQNLEEELVSQKANLIRRYEIQAAQEARAKANYIIAQATTRFASDFASERMISVINIPEDSKGRVIGKDGRNIRSIQTTTGVDIMMDDIPNGITLSHPNLYRRAVAKKTLEILIEDGRIHPGKIEETYKKVVNQFEEQMIEEGDSIILELGIGYMHEELKRLVGRLRYRASMGQNALGHSIEVARFAGVIASELGGDVKLARRAGILHDIGKALTDDFEKNHIDLGVEICTKYKENDVVLNAIKAHHGAEESRSIECCAVCTADVLSAARPGARREDVERYLNRVKDLEAIATEKFGVKSAYVIYAGRELRVIARSDLLDDAECIVLAKDIADDIKAKIKNPSGYTSEVKVNVIREIRAVEVA